MKAPYKTPYSIGEFWAEMTASSYYKNYAKANPKESAALEEHVQKKINEQADMIPSEVTNTHFGDALLMAVLTLPAHA